MNSLRYVEASKKSPRESFKRPRIVYGRRAFFAWLMDETNSISFAANSRRDEVFNASLWEVALQEREQWALPEA